MPTLHCVAEFVDGSNVMIMEGDLLDDHATSSKVNGGVVNQQVLMQVSSHQKFVEGAELNPHNPTLHRVVLTTHGKGMVLYSSLIELLSAAKCAAEGM